MAWQKRARLGVAVFGIACAIGVYAAMGERDKPAPAPVIERVDPKAVIESQGNVLQQVRGSRQDYLIKADQQLTYEGGASKLVGVEISVRNRGGRDYVITAGEAQAGERQQELRLTGDVTLVASDGFEISAAEAFFSEGDGTVRTPGAFAFRRGRMHGTGLGMLYDKNADILTITDKATVSLTSDDDSMVTEFTAGNSVFTRPSHLLTLGGLVHVIRGGQVIDADQGVAHLSDDDATVGLIELRGHSQVLGSGRQLDVLTARDIDLSYASDGRTLEHVMLRGEGTVGTTGQEDTPERQIFGESLDIALAPDGSLTRLSGRDGVRLNLAATPDAPARSIGARRLDGVGEGEKGLTAVQFAEDVVYTEAARRETAARAVRSRTLNVSLLQDVIGSAVFTGAVRFEEQGLGASGAEMLYEPGKGTLRLKGRDAGGGPRVADAQLTVEATTIDIALAGRKMSAAGSVNTTLRPRASAPATANRPGQARVSEAGGRGMTSTGSSKLPGLLEQDRPANVSGQSFEYEGEAGTATYVGNATLWQGDTAIRADRIVLDQASGDLMASGNARSTIVLDTGTSVGRAARISYDEATRVIAYDATSTPGDASAARGSGAAEAKAPRPAAEPELAQVSGSQGDLRATRIEIVLAQSGSHVERLEAYARVTMKVDMRTATGARLTYFAGDERYVMTSAGSTPVRVVEQCGDTTGRTLTFFKASDRIIVDGNEEIRTQRTGSGTCSEPAPR